MVDQQQGPPVFPGSGTVAVEQEPAGETVLRLQGDVDSAAVARFRDRQGREPVVVDAIDAGEASFLCSSGLAVMVMAAEASLGRGGRPVLRAASHPVSRALDLSGMAGYFSR